MATKSPAEENSERKRISIPKADESVLAWWEAQKDPGLSIRLLIRNEIERNGYADTAFRPVAQLPRRGRPPGGVIDLTDGDGSFDDDSDNRAAQAAPVAQAAPIHVAPAQIESQERGRRAARAEREAQVPAYAGSSGSSAIDDIMNS